MERSQLALLVVGIPLLLLATFAVIGYAQTTTWGKGGSMMNGIGGMGGMGMGDSHMGGMMGDDHMQYCHGYGGQNYASGNTVAIRGYAFRPQTLRVPVGTTVTWTNMDAVGHSIVSGEPDAPAHIFESGLLGNMQSFSYTFNQAGTYTYYCGPHPYMTGTIVVEV